MRQRTHGTSKNPERSDLEPCDVCGAGEIRLETTGGCRPTRTFQFMLQSLGFIPSALGSHWRI